MKKIRIGKRVFRWETPVITVSAVIIAVTCSVKYNSIKRAKEIDRQIIEAADYLYGFDRNMYTVIEGDIESGETLSQLLEGYAGLQLVDRIVTAAKPTFDFRNMRVGNRYAIFADGDSTGLKLRHFVYEKNSIDMIYVTVTGDSVEVKDVQKEQTIVRRKVTADIDSSLWNCIVDHQLPVSLAANLEDIFGWSVDFFGLQKGDYFTVVFDEKYIEDKSVGSGTVWGAVFHHNGKDYYAIPFDQSGRMTYWDENGKSLKKQFLKAPLRYTRISSRFSNSRMHPILKIRRPHHGVDYAAPSGTPIVSVANGSVTAKYWDSKGGGKVLKIKHANGYSTTYMHLSGYAKGIAVGRRVDQGQLIAYVGTTGRSTGPHLDFRLYKNGTAMDPLKVPSTSEMPISSGNKAAFENIKTKVMTELSGDVPEEQRITIYDIYPSRRPEITLSAEDSVRLNVKKNVVWKALSEIEK